MAIFLNADNKFVKYVYIYNVEIIKSSKIIFQKNIKADSKLWSNGKRQRILLLLRLQGGHLPILFVLMLFVFLQIAKTGILQGST